jgi:hypothetical protein
VLSSFLAVDLKHYTVEIISQSQGVFLAWIPAGVSFRQDSSQNTILNEIVLNYDVIKPMISEISVIDDTNTWWFLVTFNEAVLGVDVSDFGLKGRASSLIISAVNSVSKKQYKVNISNLDVGTISLQLKSTIDITDVIGNSIVLGEF